MRHGNYPFREVPLPEAVTLIRERLYGHFKIQAGQQEMADRLGVSLRTIAAWQAGETGVGHRHIRPLQALAQEANVAITPDSMVHGSGSRKRGKK